MRKWWLIGSLAVLLVLVGILLPVLFPWPSKVNRANYERIELGMSRAEVEAIFGGPPGDYRTRPVTIPSTSTWEVTTPGTSTWNVSVPLSGEVSWSGDEGDAVIQFDASGVRSLRFKEAVPVPIGPLNLALWRLNRIKDRRFSSTASPSSTPGP
jgi:hypothetical protein